MNYYESKQIFSGKSRKNLYFSKKQNFVKYFFSGRVKRFVQVLLNPSGAINI